MKKLKIILLPPPSNIKYLMAGVMAILFFCLIPPNSFAEEVEEKTEKELIKEQEKAEKKLIKEEEEKAEEIEELEEALEEAIAEEDEDYIHTQITLEEVTTDDPDEELRKIPEYYIEKKQITGEGIEEEISPEKREKKKYIFYTIRDGKLYKGVYEPLELKEAGIDFTRFIRRFDIRYRYEDFDNISKKRHRIMFRYTQPLARRTGEFRIDVPIMSAKTFGDKEQGLGDIRIRGNVLMKSKKYFRSSFALEFILDTASDRELGRGKNQIAPWLIFTFLPTVNRQLRFMPTFKYAVSFSGDEDRRDVNEFFFRPIVDYQTLTHYWIRIDPEFVFDFDDNSESHLFLKFQGGRMFSKTLGGWVEIGTDHNEDGLIRNIIEFGIRFIF